MRCSEGTPVKVFGTGTPSSMVPRDFNGDTAKVDWADHESDDQWVWVRMDDTRLRYRVHAIQLVPV